ncbi:G2/M phase-specific E3 ubiquitin-protein ligase-like [Xenentodon cancila]
MGLTARITIDYSWSAYQIESRLAFLFRGWFVKKAGQRFSFTYLQCVQGSRALFVPETPAEGWTGEHVIRISGHSALYILSHHDYPQVDSDSSAGDTSVVSSSEFCLEASTERDIQLVRQINPRMSRTPERLTLNLDTLLSLYRQDNVNAGVQIHIWARRGDVLYSALKAVRRPGFCFRSTPVVSFSEETKTHQESIGEFFRLSLLELQQSCVFEGHPGRLFLTYDLTALEDRKYYEAGVLIGWSLAQGGPGPYCLHPALYQLLCNQSPSLEDFNWLDIVDAEAQIRLQELHGCRDVKLLSPSLCDWVSYCGIPGIYSARSDEIPTIYARLVKHYLYHRVASMISQFTEGLNSCGRLWDLVKSHWEMFLPIMTSSEHQQPLALGEFKRLFAVRYSPPDSELRAAEEATVSHWGTILTMVSDRQADFSLQDLLIFITGAHRLPPLGFPKPISLCFYSQVGVCQINMKILQSLPCLHKRSLYVEQGTTTDVRLPYVSVCSLELFLPRGVVDAVDLLVLLNKALQKAVGFTYLAEDDVEENCTELVT